MSSHDSGRMSDATRRDPGTGGRQTQRIGMVGEPPASLAGVLRSWQKYGIHAVLTTVMAVPIVILQHKNMEITDENEELKSRVAALELRVSGPRQVSEGVVGGEGQWSKALQEGKLQVELVMSPGSEVCLRR